MTREPANAEQRKYWKDVAGPRWVACRDALDAQLAPYGERLIQRAQPVPGMRVLDVGCGCGGFTLELAQKVQPGGAVTGADVSVPMLEQARQAARDGALDVRFLELDAQTDDLGERQYDLIVSRFGVMFFENPGAAFANLRAAFREGGRLVFVCWQSAQRNPWVTLPAAAAEKLVPMPPPPPPDAPGMFALGNEERLRTLLSQAGFAEVTLEEDCQPIVPAGVTAAGAAQAVMALSPALLAAQLTGADADALRDRLLHVLETTFAQYEIAGQVRMPAAAWIVSAR